MGYRKCDGDYCGKCLLNMRGWKIDSIPLNYLKKKKKK